MGYTEDGLRNVFCNGYSISWTACVFTEIARHGTGETRWLVLASFGCSFLSQSTRTEIARIGRIGAGYATYFAVGAPQ